MIALRTTVLALAAALLAVPAAAQSGVEAYNGNWQGATFVVEAGSWPEIAPEDFRIAIGGDSRTFEAEWTGLEPDGDTVAWDEFDAEFEAADRAGYFAIDDLPDFFDGDAQYWAHAGEAELVIGRLQLDDDTGRHVLFVCHLTRTEAGLDAQLVLSTADAPSARARLELVRQ